MVTQEVFEIEIEYSFPLKSISGKTFFPLVLMISVSRLALPGAESIAVQTNRQTEIFGYYNIEKDFKVICNEIF